jgi:radical SAM superfamily enzyme YgiQ (UPF0313 family)
MVARIRSEKEINMDFQRPDIIRPPSEARCYFLPLTSGCSNNSCIFCNYYGCKLQIRELNEVKREIDALLLYTKHGIRIPEIPALAYMVADEWDGRRIFLQDGDALVHPKIKEVLEYLGQKFPELERISCYATPQDILRYDLDELKTLKDLKLGMFYLGVESGNEEILQDIGKGVNSRQMLEAGKKVKAAGITLSVSVILGLGGTEHSQEHALATANILSGIDPEFAGALTLTLVTGTPLYERYRKREFALISPKESLQELRTIIEHSRLTNCFFSSMHASNYLSIRGILPGDKEKMLSQLEYVLSRDDDRLLRPEYLRGL